MTKWDATAAATRGAAYLDEVEVDWVDTIDVASLDVSRTCDCPLGQRYGDFWIGLDRLDIRVGDAIALGFHVPKTVFLDDAAREATFIALTAAWREEIALRRLQRLSRIEEVAAV